MKKSKKILFLLLFLISGFLYYFIFVLEPERDYAFKQEKVLVKRVLDGDSLELEDGRKLRMLGINTPEKGKFLSNEAVSFTKNLELKNTTILYNKKDRYGRILGYVIFNEENFNKKLVEEGLAHKYYYDKDIFYEEIKNAEEKARFEKKGIWKESKNKDCLSLIKFEYKEKTKRCSNEEFLFLENKCNYSLKILIKDDSTKQFEETIYPGFFSKNFSCVFNDEGDSLYIWDSDGLILFYRYP